MRVVYVCRVPPSPSGLGLYAQEFINVLGKKASVTVIGLPAQPRDSQRFKAIFKILKDFWQVSEKSCVVLVDLGGRGIAEFWFTVFISLVTRRRVWIVIHDPPSLCGGAFYFLSLDRKGLRRVADFLSKSLGYVFESLLLANVDQAICLSEAGSKSISMKYRVKREIKTIPHISTQRYRKEIKNSLILIPGYVGEDDQVSPVLEAMIFLPDNWKLKIGLCSVYKRSLIMSEVSELRLEHRVEFLDQLSERNYLMTFDEASIVVRCRENWIDVKSNSHSVSGPLIYAMASGCVIVTNDSRGIYECLSDAGAIFFSKTGKESDSLVDVIVRLVQDKDELSFRATKSVLHSYNHHSEEIVTRLLNELDAC